MEQYTIEDIELLRKKGAMSYQEAVALLDYHNGNLARALIDLEKSGRLQEMNESEKEGQKRMSEGNKKTESKGKVLNFIQKLYRSRIKIRKGNTGIVNFSVIFGALCLLFAPHMTIAGIIVSMILGYQFSFTGMDPDFAGENLDSMVRNAAQNAKSSVSSVVRTISTEANNRSPKVDSEEKNQESGKEDARPAGPSEKKDHADGGAEELRKQARELEETMDSFFDNSPSFQSRQSAYSAAASSVPTIQVPVQAETREGEISIEDENDGYSSVTIG